MFDGLSQFPAVKGGINGPSGTTRLLDMFVLGRFEKLSESRTRSYQMRVSCNTITFTNYRYVQKVRG